MFKDNPAKAIGLPPATPFLMRFGATQTHDYQPTSRRRIDPNDPVFQYLTGAPPPRREHRPERYRQGPRTARRGRQTGDRPDAAGSGGCRGCRSWWSVARATTTIVRYAQDMGRRASNRTRPSDRTRSSRAHRSPSRVATLLAAAGVGVEPQGKRQPAAR